MDFPPASYGYKRDYVPFWTTACSICDETLSAVVRSYTCPCHVRSYIRVHVRVTVVVVYVAKSARVICVATRVVVVYVSTLVVCACFATRVVF